MIPCKTICIDIIDPFTVTDRLGNGRILNTMAFVNPAIGWFKITEIPDKISARTSQMFHIWKTHYQQPRKLIFDNGNEFKKDVLHY